MTPRLVAIGAIVTAATVVAAAVAVGTQPNMTRVELTDAPAFPQLRDSPEAVATITIMAPGETFTLVRGDDGAGDDWSIRERHGYPAEGDGIRELVATLAGMRLVEAKTARPDRFARLEVEDPNAEGATSRAVRLETADGDVVAEAVIGKRVHVFTGGREAGTYLRRPGDGHAWLASGSLEVATNPTSWLQNHILDVPADTVQRIRVSPSDGEAYEVSRESADAEFAVSPVPEGRRPAASAVRRLAAAFADLELDDVAAVDSVSLPTNAARVTVETFDGLRVSARVGGYDGGRTWALFATEGSATELSERLKLWAFGLTTSKAAALAPSLESLLEPQTDDSAVGQ